jgi:hypothetical protein
MIQPSIMHAGIVTTHATTMRLFSRGSFLVLNIYT